jgi:hypothetical protein
MAQAAAAREARIALASEEATLKRKRAREAEQEAEEERELEEPEDSYEEEEGKCEPMEEELEESEDSEAEIDFTRCAGEWINNISDSSFARKHDGTVEMRSVGVHLREGLSQTTLTDEAFSPSSDRPSKRSATYTGNSQSKRKADNKARREREREMVKLGIGNLPAMFAAQRRRQTQSAATELGGAETLGVESQKLTVQDTPTLTVGQQKWVPEYLAALGSLEDFRLYDVRGSLDPSNKIAHYKAALMVAMRHYFKQCVMRKDEKGIKGKVVKEAALSLRTSDRSFRTAIESYLRHTNTVVLPRWGKHSKRLDASHNEEVLQKLHDHLSERKGFMSVKEAMSFLNKAILPAVYGEEAAVSLGRTTTQSMIKELGWRFKRIGKEVYIDGHSRSDVVMHRKNYCADAVR